MARTAWKPPDYNDVRRAMDARRRELAAKMRLGKAKSSELMEVVSTVETSGGLAGPLDAGRDTTMMPGVASADGIKEAPCPSAALGSGLLPEAVTAGLLSETPAALSANEASAGSWLEQVGLGDRAGLGMLAGLLREAAHAPLGSLRVDVSWPSQWPNPVLAWAARSISGLDAEDDELRVLFLRAGRSEIRDLDSCLVPRVSAVEGWPPERGSSVLREAMRTAFVQGRLLAGAPDGLPLSWLVPCLHVEPPDSPTRWKNRWDGFLGSARKYVNRKSRGRYGHYWERYGDPGSCRPFGFLIPKISIEKRRSEEIAEIRGGVDLVVVDLSDRNLSSWNVGVFVEQAVLDVAAGLERTEKAMPPILVLASDPAAGQMAMKAAGDLMKGDIVTSRRLIRRFWRGERGGAAPANKARDPSELAVQGAFTHEDEIVEALLVLANKLLDGRPKTAAALADAAYMLCAMARTTRPPCADGRYPEETSRWFADEATAVRDALREEGDVSEREAIDEALKKGRDAATRLLQETPARLALKEAVQEARRGRRVVFVADRVSDALAAGEGQQEHDLLVVYRIEAVPEIGRWRPQLLVLACRGADALRILLEVVEAPSEIRILLTPDDAQVAARSAEIALEWAEMAPVHARCSELLRRMPPRLTKVLGLATHLPAPRSNGAGIVNGRNGGDGTGVDRARAEVVALFDNGETVPFAQGATVIVLRGSDPVERRVRDLKEGDQVVLPPQDIVDDIARELGWAGEQALIDHLVDRYKKAVGAWRIGPGDGISAREIARRMQVADPTISAPSTAAIRYWLSASEHEDKATPFAPGRPDWFAAFCAAIGFAEGGSGEVARHFHIFRARLRQEGHVRTGLVERMLFDRYNAIIHLGLSQERVDELRRRALRFVSEITALEKGGMWKEEER